MRFGKKTTKHKKQNRNLTVVRKLQRCKESETDWTLLKQGDIIRVLSSAGPYRINKNKDKIRIGHYGLFRVKEVDDNGILGYDIKRGGFSYIYMGKVYETIYGTIMESHKIKKVEL